MLDIQVSKNFKISEFVPPEIFNKYGEKSIWFMDFTCFGIAQFIRDRFGKPVTINNWKNGGQYKLSGFRPPDTTTGAKYSQHKFGRAIDVKVAGVTPAELRDDIKGSYLSEYQPIGVTTIEAGTSTWTHIDCRNTGSDELLIVPFR